ncbi:MAG: recombination mediator RecR [Oscillospiraceae bacterium]
MSYNVAALSKLIEQFERMPSVGRKSAQRMAFYVLSMSKDDAKAFANAIVDAHEKIHKCKICCNLTQDDICSVCNNDARDKSIVCVVEDPRDVMAIERTHEFNGTYHVLHGVISPLNGIGPDQLSLKQLLARMNSDEVKEVIMATNPTVEGEATAMYISKLLKPIGIKTTRLAYGVPVGADLEYADEVTLSRAMEGRRVM